MSSDRHSCAINCGYMVKHVYGMFECQAAYEMKCK
ncbi:hypothetical protein T4A_4550 [Trichinella pseudospiralis]|uniref:Uncharacterized protein n=1 Tax=Trichinella pseudospiralis TaxID=6337 RepID=A0A0V1DT04_TRIPS|nr:hypothetical protein T4A_4550 [Trichinella pseudospiralis]KRZ05215.1 hypothetical protein T4C_12883 [Trichinella pseudospiralis]